MAQNIHFSVKVTSEPLQQWHGEPSWHGAPWRLKWDGPGCQGRLPELLGRITNLVASGRSAVCQRARRRQRHYSRRPLASPRCSRRCCRRSRSAGAATKRTSESRPGCLFNSGHSHASCTHGRSNPAAATHSATTVEESAESRKGRREARTRKLEPAGSAGTLAWNVASACESAGVMR